MQMNTNIKTVDDYINRFGKDLQALLTKIRSTIADNAPHAVESISYGMPAYKMNGKPLVYFAAFKNQIGFYATPTGHEAFKKELTPYKQGKGSVQFPLDQPIPYDLIRQIVIFRVKESQAKGVK